MILCPLENLIQKRTGFGARGIGFASDDEDELLIKQALLKEVSPDDLIHHGLIPEFVGRLPIIGVLEPLSKEMMIDIMRKPKNAILKQFVALLKLDGVKLEFAKGSLEAIATEAMTRKTGARGLRSIIETILLKTMFRLPAMVDVEKVIVNQAVVKNNSEPLITHSKKKKTTAA